MKRNKVKRFLKDNGKTIAIVAITGIIGGVCGYSIHANSKDSKAGLEALECLEKIWPCINGAKGAFGYTNTDETKTIRELHGVIDELIDKEGINLDNVITGVTVFVKENVEN